jgi:hypothetical protein
LQSDALWHPLFWVKSENKYILMVEGAACFLEGSGVEKGFRLEIKISGNIEKLELQAVMNIFPSQQY